MDDTTNMRTPGGILLKLFILKFAVATATGYLGSLRRMPTDYHYAFVLWSIALPLVPAIDFAFNIVLTSRNVIIGRERELNYILGSLAGVYWIEDDPHSEERHQIGFLNRSDLQHLRDDISLKTVRVLVVLGFTAQVIATLFLLIRRINIVGIFGFAPDEHALLSVVSGLAVAFETLAIQFTNQKWRRYARLPSSFPTSKTYPLAQRLLYNTILVSAQIPLSMYIVYMGFPIWAACLLSCITCVVFALSSCSDTRIIDITFNIRTSRLEYFVRDVLRWLTAFIIFVIITAYGFLASYCWIVDQFFLLFLSDAVVDPAIWSWSDPLSDKLWVY